MRPRLDIRTVREDGQPLRLIVAGEIDMPNAEQFRVALADVTACHDRVIVDLTDLEVFGSAGIGALYRYADRVAVVFVTSGSVIGRALSVAGTNMVVAVPRRTEPSIMTCTVEYLADGPAGPPD